MKKIILTIIIISNSFFLTGCLLVSTIGSGILVANDRRMAGEIIDDKNIELKLFDWVGSDNTLKNAHLNFMVYRKEVLITGELPSASARAYLSKQTLRNFTINRLINETSIAPNTGLLSRGKDSAITIKIETKFLDQEVFNPIHVKVTTENMVVYLMGSVTKREANKALDIVTGTGGVKKVVKLFHYLKNRPIAEIERDKQRKINEQKESLLLLKDTQF